MYLFPKIAPKKFKCIYFAKGFIPQKINILNTSQKFASDINSNIREK